MSNPNDIPKLATALLKDNDLYSVPTNVRSLASTLNIDIQERDLEESLSGFLVVKEGVATVVLNKFHHENRKRFTLAHEIGHLQLHVGGRKESLFMEKKQVYNRNVLSSTGTDQQEIEANRYAANLLMPEEFVRFRIAQEKENEFVNDFSGDSNSIEVLANLFEVSQEAFGHRLSSLL